MFWCLLNGVQFPRLLTVSCELCSLKNFFLSYISCQVLPIDCFCNCLHMIYSNGETWGYIVNLLQYMVFVFILHFVFLIILSFIKFSFTFSNMKHLNKCSLSYSKKLYSALTITIIKVFILN